MVRDCLAHRASLLGIGVRHVVCRLSETDTLETNAHAGVVHEHQHVLEALAALADELRRRALERQSSGHCAVVAQLFFVALESDVSLSGSVGEIVVRLHQEHRQARQALHGVPRVLRVFAARQYEVVFAVPGGDEDLLPRDEPVAVLVTLGARAQRGHVASGVRLGDVHAAPSLPARDLADRIGKARGRDPPGLDVELRGPLPDRVRERGHRHALVEGEMVHARGVGARDHLAAEEVQKKRCV